MWTKVAGNPQLLYFWKVLFTLLIRNTREVTRNIGESLTYLQRGADSFLLSAQRTVSLGSFTMLQKESYNARYVSYFDGYLLYSTRYFVHVHTRQTAIEVLQKNN